MESKIIDRLNSLPSRWMIGPGRGIVMEGPPNGNSPFASLLINTLKNNNNEKLLISDLIQQLIANTKSDSRQIPIGGPMAGVGHDGGEFVFKIKDNQDRKCWDRAINIDSIESYNNYIKTYPNGTHVSIAQKQISKLKEYEKWNLCIKDLNIKNFNEYLIDFSFGKYIKEARAFVSILSEGSQDKSVLNENIEKFCLSLCTKIQHFKDFKINFPKSHLIMEANSEIEKLAEFINQEIISKCKEKFMAGKTDDIFQILLSKKMNEDFQTDLFLISNQWNTLNRNKDRGVINFDDFTKNSNQIRMAILNLLNNIEREV
jgi:hypothetical protein